MPAVQQIYASFTSLTFVEPAVDKLREEIKNLNKSNIDQNQNILSPKDKISLKNIFYSYPNASVRSLKDVSLNIPVRSTIGLVGILVVEKQLS